MTGIMAAGGESGGRRPAPRLRFQLVDFQGK
jgi:hypothetical protein